MISTSFPHTPGRSMPVILAHIWLEFVPLPDSMCPRGTRGAYRKEERAQLPQTIQKRLVEAAASRFGTLEKLAKELELPKSSVHYYRAGRLTMPVSVMERMLELASDEGLTEDVRGAANTKDRTWANSYAASVHREMCRERLRLPTVEELEKDDELRRKAAAIVSYVMAEGSIWIKHNRFDAGMVNITFADHETDLYDHFRSLSRDVFEYDIGPPQKPGNGARAIRGFICSRFIAEWLVANGVPAGEKAAVAMRIPTWVMESEDEKTMVGALQPFFDGEGHVRRSKDSRRASVVVVQARHTDLDFMVLPRRLGWRGRARTLPSGLLAHSQVFGTDTIVFSSMLYRSEVLDDASTLLRRLGFAPRLRLSSMYLKDDGFWSAHWALGIGTRESLKLADAGILTQSHKVAKARTVRGYNHIFIKFV